MPGGGGGALGWLALAPQQCASSTSLEHDTDCAPKVAMLPAPNSARPPAHLVRGDGDARPHRAHRLGRHARLALPHVPLAEQELPVQVAGLDGVQVDLRRETDAEQNRNQ